MTYTNVNDISLQSSSYSSPSSLPASQQIHPWRSYFTIDSLLRTKSPEMVMAEAAEDNGELDCLSCGPPSPQSSSSLNAGLLASGSSDSTPAEINPNAPKKGLAKVLTLWDVIAYGIGSTIGAGIFVSTGAGTRNAGPAVSISFFLASMSCLFSAFAYCEFAARVPVSGSAYTFAYVCLGELAAWFIGWNLTLEYSISAAAVARGWSGNLNLFFKSVNVNYPQWLDTYSISDDPHSTFSSVSIGSAFICIFCTFILLLGVKESSRLNLIITVMNISVILFIIILGATYIHPENWVIGNDFPNPPNSTISAFSLLPEGIAATVTEATSVAAPAGRRLLASGGVSGFFPNGANGLLTGAAQVFFSYVGFDCVTTLAEEVKNPKRDLPIGIMVTLAISTFLYIGATIVLTGMIPWNTTSLDTPLASAFSAVGNTWATIVIAACSVTGLTCTVLTSLFGQPRIFYRMAKDGLFFNAFAVIHPKTQAPLWGTVIPGVCAALISFFLSIESLQNMISIGTLMAFTTVLAGVIIMRYQVPSFDIWQLQRIQAGQASENVRFISYLWRHPSFLVFIYMLPTIATCITLRNLPDISIGFPIAFGIASFAVAVRISFLSVNTANYNPNYFMCPLVPFLPCAGMFTNIYLITSLDWESYIRIIVWTAVGFAIYFGYGIRHSRLGHTLRRQNELGNPLLLESASDMNKRSSKINL